MIQTRKSKGADNEWHNRNAMLDEFFQRLGMEVVIIGDPNNPAVIHKSMVLALYIHNYNIHFQNKCERGEDMYQCRVDARPKVDELTNWFKTAQHNKAYRIKIVNAPVYICGTAFNTGRPVFGDSDFHYYLTLEYAVGLLDKFDLSYCEIV